MSTMPGRCPKCGGEMEEGFIIDNTYGGHQVSHWARGAPQRSLWTGTKLPEDKEVVPVGTFRCASCGYLESFARDEFSPH